MVFTTSSNYLFMEVLLFAAQYWAKFNVAIFKIREVMLIGMVDFFYIFMKYFIFILHQQIITST